MEVALVVVVVFTMIMLLAIFVAPQRIPRTLQRMDLFYNFGHYAAAGMAHVRTQTPLGIHSLIYQIVTAFLSYFLSGLFYTGGLLALLLAIPVFAIIIISYGTYIYPATAINSLSPTPLTFVNPLPTIITLRMFVYRGPCTTQPVTSNSFRMW